MRLPKEHTGIKFNELCFVEFNNFDVDQLIPAFFWMVRSNGKPRVDSSDRDPVSLTGKLVAHNNMVGFESNAGQRVLSKWLRTSTFQPVRQGRSRTGREEVSYIKPLTFLIYKGPTPRGGSLRQTHLFLHDLLLRHINQGRDNVLYQVVRNAFARGVELTDGAAKDGIYDGHTHVDLEVLLSLYFLDGLPGVREGTSKLGKPGEPTCPLAAKTFAEDVVLFLSSYGKLLSATELASHFAALLNFEFFHYSLNLYRGTNSLVNGHESPELSHEQGVSRLEVYVDMTQDRTGRSSVLAQSCINRDIEEAESYLRSSILLKTTFDFLSENLEIRKQVLSAEGCNRIRLINSLRDHPDIQSDARSLLKKLRIHFRGQYDDEELSSDVCALLDEGATALDRASNTLYNFQRNNAVNNIMKWIQMTGGLRRGDGILEGNLRGRRNWRYALSDQLLEIFCMIAAACPEVQEASGRTWKPNTMAQPILLSAFLEFLKKRYGILIAEPPGFEQSAESMAAAKENLNALRRRLRQMGLFQDLSDDFNAQRIVPRPMQRMSR